MYFRDPYVVSIMLWAAVTLAATARIALRAVRRESTAPGWALGTTWIVLTVVVLGMTAMIYAKHGFGTENAGKAPDFSVKTLDGQTLSSQTLRGKVVLLEFWATWCAPCVATMPSIAKLRQEFQGQPFVLVSVSIDEDADAWRAFVEKNKMDWPQYLDGSRELAKTFQVQGPPSYIVIGTDGQIRFRQSGWVPTTALQLDHEVRKVLQSSR